MPMDDKQIIELYFARDERAIEETKAKYGRLLLKIARGVLGDEGESEECESDTYLKVWGVIPPERPTYFAAFLSRITRNLAINRMRADKRRAAYLFRAVDEELGAIGVNDLCEEIELREAIRSFVSGLEPVRRRVFIQRYFYMLSVAEIAREQGISRGSVKSMLSRVRAKLYLYLTERGFTV